MVDRLTSITPAPLSHLSPNEDAGVVTLGGRGAVVMSETLIARAQAARLLPTPRQGKPVQVRTGVRWIRRGVGGARLEAARAGGRWITSREAVARFLAALTASHSSRLGADTRAAGAAEQRRHERVEERLNR